MSDLLVLAYHAVSGSWPAGFSVGPEMLERQLSSLIDRGYRGATFTEAVSGAQAGRTLVVTFDDAYRSVFESAHPVMRELGIPGTVFAPTAFIGAGRPMSWPGISQWVDGPHAEELVPMSWDQLGQLAAEGWEIGSHTRTHPRLPELDVTAQREELAGSRADCEVNLGVPCTSLAYPYADCNPAVAEVARGVGYSAACAVSRRLTRGDPLLFPRVGVYRTDHPRRFRTKVSPVVRRARLGSLWAARRLPRALGRRRTAAPG